MNVTAYLLKPDNFILNILYSQGKKWDLLYYALTSIVFNVNFHYQMYDYLDRTELQIHL